MRDILFRGKDIDGKWVGGCYIVDEMDTNKAYIGYIFGSDGRQPHDVDVVLVDPETVCQYTGLIDKNGRNIFEGDILRSDDNKIGQVQWFEEHSAFMIWNNTDNKVHFLYDNNFSRIEVIGNVFDNPDLIGDQP